MYYLIYSRWPENVSKKFNRRWTPRMEMGVRIEIEEISLSYKGKNRQRKRVLEGVNLTIETGELLTLIGPSGAGKSTLLRLIAGLESPTAGQVKLEGSSVLDIPPARRSVGILFQDAPLFPGLSAFQNLAMSLKRRGLEGDRIEAEVAKMARRFQLEDRLSAFPEELSVGERQRVALARAMVGEPRVLLLDEPLSGLDPELRYVLKEEILSWREQSGATLVCVTHDPADGLTMGDRVAVIESGTLLQVDVPESVYRQPANRFVAGFVGYPPMNFIPGKVVASERGVVFQIGRKPTEAFSFPVPGIERWESLSGRDVVLGVRPRDIRVEKWDEAQHGLQGKVRRLEDYLDERYVMVDCQDFRVTAVCGDGQELCPGAPVSIGIRDSNSCHWFDAVTSRRISNHEC